SSKFETIKQVRIVLKQAVLNYNNKRPHWALNFKVPSQVYKAA
ncbi:MAG: transposase, partial [Fluviicola sp.]|nr:transposase [Fluviicola sp.]